MKYYTFYSEQNDFKDILNDPIIKAAAKTKIKSKNFLTLGFGSTKKNNNLFGYLVLKYGEMIKHYYNKDYTPIPYIDYVPINSKNL